MIQSTEPCYCAECDKTITINSFIYVCDPACRKYCEDCAFFSTIVHIVQKESFDNVRSLMTNEEILSLLRNSEILVSKV